MVFAELTPVLHTQQIVYTLLKLLSQRHFLSQQASVVQTRLRIHLEHKLGDLDRSSQPQHFLFVRTAELFEHGDIGGTMCEEGDLRVEIDSSAPSDLEDAAHQVVGQVLDHMG